VAREAGIEDAVGRSSRSGSPISNGSLENLLHPGRLQPDVVLLGRGSRAPWFGTG
jgi:hypothetical protein